MVIRRLIEQLLDGFAAVIFPTLLVAIAGWALLLRFGQAEAVPGQVLPIRVWMQESTRPMADHKDVLETLRRIPPVSVFKTELSTSDVWFALDVGSRFNGDAQVV